MQQIFDVRYVGRCKDKGRGSQAFGWVGDAWMVIFPETVLRAWFQDAGIPGESSSLYAVLGVDAQAQSETIRVGYRRMALQWHPDRNKDPDAHNQFLWIQEAYDVLSNPVKRAKYDAGLKLLEHAQRHDRDYEYVDVTKGYRAPLKCGFVMVDGNPSGKWFVVKQILAWEDITFNGRTLTTSWPMGANKPVEMWL